MFNPGIYVHIVKYLKFEVIFDSFVYQYVFKYT